MARYEWDPPQSRVGRSAEALLAEIEAREPTWLPDYEAHYERVVEETEAELDQRFTSFTQWLDWAESELREAYGK
jgi:hypothetical protein